MQDVRSLLGRLPCSVVPRPLLLPVTLRVASISKPKLALKKVMPKKWHKHKCPNTRHVLHKKSALPEVEKESSLKCPFKFGHYRLNDLSTEVKVSTAVSTSVWWQAMLCLFRNKWLKLSLHLYLASLLLYLMPKTKSYNRKSGCPWSINHPPGYAGETILPQVLQGGGWWPVTSFTQVHHKLIIYKQTRMRKRSIISRVHPSCSPGLTVLTRMRGIEPTLKLKPILPEVVAAVKQPA